MNILTRSLSLAAIAASLLTVSPAFADDTLIDLNFEAMDAGSPPPVSAGSLPATQALDSVFTTDNNKLKVVKDSPEFPGKALQFIKGAADPRTPRAVFANTVGLVTSGSVRFTWEASMNSFEASEKFPGFESTLSFVLMDAVGKPFFNFYYLVNSSQTAGIFGSMGKKLGSWSMGSKQQFEVTVDLDNGTAVIKVDGTEVGDETIHFERGEGLRVVQFTDGAGLAFYGSRFSATIDNFKMTRL